MALGVLLSCRGLKPGWGLGVWAAWFGGGLGSLFGETGNGGFCDVFGAQTCFWSDGFRESLEGLTQIVSKSEVFFSKVIRAVIVQRKRLAIVPNGWFCGSTRNLKD